MSFLNSLDIGKTGEDAIIKLFEIHQITAEVVNKKYYDVAFTLGDDDWRHVEVKYDVMAAKTGNLAIEIFNSKSETKSGLTATKAEIWAVVLSDPASIYFANTTELKKFVKNTTPLKEVKFGGDKNAHLKIFKKEVILPVFTQVDTLEREDFVCLLKKLANIPS